MGGVDWVARFRVLLRRRVKIRAKRCHGKMKRSPIFPRDENGGCNEVGFDPWDDFSKFLEEARKHVNEEKLEPELPSSFSMKKKMETEGGKSGGSWKNSLLFWWRFEKKCTPAQNTLTNRAMHGAGAPQVSKLRQGAASGPIAGGRSKTHICRPVSGPLAGCFTPTRVDEGPEIPYMWLEQLNTPSRNQAFGPIYLVT